MANKPVLGVMKCPYCGTNNLTAWDGNFKICCYSCRKPFIVKRQKLKYVKPLQGSKEG